MDSVLHLLGIARKAGRVEVGEEPVGAAARAHQAKLILTAADGAEVAPQQEDGDDSQDLPETETEEEGGEEP